jgi:hypothetical protein
MEYADWTTEVVLADQLLMPSPLDPAAAKIQVANQLSKLNINLHHIEPEQIIIEWTRG